MFNTSIDKQDRKQPILPPGRNANQPTHEPMTPISNVKYAQPGAMYQPSFNPKEVLLPESVSGQYQGLRASGVDMISAYNIPQVRKHGYSGGEGKADPKYANLPL